MATRVPTYLDFYSGEIKEVPSGDTLDSAYLPPGSGSGDVSGPASSTANAIAVFNGTTGKTIKDSEVTVAELLAGQVITQVEIDFGATPVQQGIFTISHTGAISGTRIIAAIAYDAPTGKDLDELDMDELIIKCGNATANQFTMFVKSADGSSVSDKFKINYITYNP